VHPDDKRSFEQNIMYSGGMRDGDDRDDSDVTKTILVGQVVKSLGRKAKNKP
jgi:hypothetical protein